MLKALACVSAGVFVLSLAVHTALEHTRAWINISDSLPYGLYQTEKNDGSGYHSGDLVLSCVPELYAHYAFDRGYIAAGSCSAKTAPVGKYIAAAPGDHVIINEDGVFVNGRLMQNSRPALMDSEGQRLIARKMNRVLGDGEYILLNPKMNSFDSRYFGVVSEEHFIAKLRELYTLADNS